MDRKKNEITIRSSAAEYLNYVAVVGDNPEYIEVRYEDENIQLTQRMLATLYNVNVATINEHIANIQRDNELEKDSRGFLFQDTLFKPNVAETLQEILLIIILI